MKIYFLLLCLLSIRFTHAQKILFARNSVGYIKQFNAISIDNIGSGCVVINNKLILTAAHVVNDSGVYLYQGQADNVLHLLKLIKIDQSKDLALLESMDSVSQPSFIINPKPDLKIGDPIIYLGWDTITNEITKSKTTIFELDSTKIDNLNTIALYAPGNAQQGYSGGPIISSKGELIGVVSHGTPIENTRYANLKGTFKNYYFGVLLLNFLEEFKTKPPQGRNPGN